MTNKRVIPKLKRLFYIVYLTTAKAANENPKVGLNNPKVAMDFTCIGGPQPASPSGLWHLYTLALRIRTLGHTKLRVRVGPTLLGRGAAKGPRFLLAPATTGRPPGKWKAERAALKSIAGSCLSRAHFARSVAFDSFLASFVYIKDPRQNRLYLGLEHLTEAAFKPTLRQPTPKLSIFETALIAAIWALTASYTLFFFLTLISIFNLVLLFRQALSTLTPRLIPPLATILKRVWPPHLLSLLTLASKPPLALRTFTLTRFIVFASFFVNLVKKNLRALVLGSKKPNPVASPFVVRVSKKVQRKAWPPYTDESGRLYFRRTLVGGVKTTPRRPSKVLGFLLLTLMVLLLPTEAVTKLNMLWPLAAAYLTLRVVFKVRPKILKLAQGCRSFGPRLRRCFFALRPWGLFGNKALGAKAGGATEAALLRLELLAGGALPKLRNLGLVWVRIKTTPRLMFLWKTEVGFRDSYGGLYKLRVESMDAHTSIEGFREWYVWWAEEWPKLVNHCKRTAPYKPLPIGKVIYKNLKNFKKGLWSEPFVVWLPHDDWESPVCPVTTLGVLSELADDYALHRQVRLADPYPIGIFGWTPKYMELRFEAKLFEVNNALLAEWDEFQSEFENDFEYEVMNYLISRKIRFEGWKGSLRPRSRVLHLNLFRYGPWFSTSSNLFLYEPTVVTRYFFLGWWSTEEVFQTEWTPLLRVGVLPCTPYSHLGLGGLSRVLVKNILWRANFYRATLNRVVSLFFKPYKVVGGFAYSAIPYSPYVGLKKTLGEGVSVGLDWPSYNNKADYYPITDIPLVKVANWQTYVSHNFPAPRAVWDGAYKQYRRVIFFSLTLIYLSLAVSLAWLFLYPPRGLHGILSICKTQKCYLGPAAAMEWAVGTVRQKRLAEKATLWAWSFGALGFVRGSVYFTGSFINLPNRPLNFVPRWSFPFKGRYQRYDDPYLLRLPKLKLTWALIKDSVFRSPYSATKHNKRCGISYVGNGPRWVTGIHRPYTPFHPFDRTPWKVVMSTTPSNGWKHVCSGRFLRFCNLWFNQRIPHVVYTIRFHIIKPFFMSLASFRTIYSTLFFDTKRYLSYFFWKNTHPCNNLMVTWTRWLQPPHWGALRPSISAFHLLKHALSLLRFALVSYRFQNNLLPLLKTHIWLYYFYPLATAMEAYPSFVEPKAIALEMGGVAAFLKLSYRLLRVSKTAASPSFLYNSHNHTVSSYDSITQAGCFTLNSGPSESIVNNGASDLNYGFGGYWGFDQTYNLIGKLNNIRPYLQTLETPNIYNYPDSLPAFYRIVYPHPTAPLSPPLEKPLNVLFDKVFPRTNEYFEAMSTAGPFRPSNLSCENTPAFYKGFKATTASPSNWEGGFVNNQPGVSPGLGLNAGQSYVEQAAVVRKGLNREVCPPSLSLHGGLDTLAIKTNNLLSKCGVTKGGYFRLNSDPYAGAVFLKAPDSHLSLWDKDLRLPFEAERVLLITKANANGGPFSTKTPPGFVYPKYPYSLENYKNNHKGLDSIMFRRRMSCNHYRHILEPSDLKLRGIPDSSDPFFSLTKELDFLNLFNRPIDDRLETWGFLYKHIIIRNKVAWDWGLSFPYHWNYGLSHSYWWWFRDVFEEAKNPKRSPLPKDTKILEDPELFFHPQDFAEAMGNTFGTDISYRAEALRPVNLKYLTSPVQTYGRIQTHTALPYSFSKPSALCSEPTEMNFFHKLKPFSLNYPGAPNPYRTWPRPLPKKTTRLFDHHEIFPTNGFLLKVQKRQSTAIHHEAHPDLRSYWAKDGVATKALPLDGTLHSRHCIPPTHSNHEFKGFVLDLINLAQTWGGGLGKMLNETFYSWMFGWEFIGVVGRLISVPSKLACAVKWKIFTEPRLDLLPNLRFRLNGLRFWDFVDFVTSNNCHVVVPLMWFTVRVVFKYIKWDMWWEAEPNPVETMFRFSWGGVDKVGDFVLYGPFFTPLLFLIKAYPGFMEPFTKAAHWEVRPKFRHPIDFRRRVRWWKCWIPQKITWTIPAIWPFETYLKSLPQPFTGDALRLGKHRWWKLADVSRWDGNCLLQRPSLTNTYAKTDYHFRVVPVWLLRILFPTIQWGYYRSYHNTCHHHWWWLRPQFSFWIKGRTSYEDVFGHTCAKGDFQVWKWYPSKPFGGTLILFFGHGWPSYGPIEYPHKTIKYFLRANDSSATFINPTSAGRDAISTEAQTWKTLKAFFIYLRSPVTFLRYHFTKNFLNEGHLMWPLYDKLFTFVYTVSPFISFLWLPRFPNWGGFLLPQPPTPQFPLAASVPDPFYLTYVPFSWWKVPDYVAPFYRSSYFIFFDRKRPASYDWSEKGKPFLQGYWGESIVAEDSIYLFWPNPDLMLDFYWRPERGWHPFIHAIASNDSTAWDASN